MLNDSNAVSCTVPVFAGNEAVLFPGIQEWKMTGIPGRPGNRSPGMHTLIIIDNNVYHINKWLFNTDDINTIHKSYRYTIQYINTQVNTASKHNII